jgi:hypothetical protein
MKTALKAALAARGMTLVSFALAPSVCKKAKTGRESSSVTRMAVGLVQASRTDQTSGALGIVVRSISFGAATMYGNVASTQTPVA